MNLNLPSDLQRLAPFIAVAVLGVAGLLLVARGMGDGDSSRGADAGAVLESAFATAPRSGVLHLRLAATVAGAGRATAAPTYSFAGPFTQGEGGQAERDADF